MPIDSKDLAKELEQLVNNIKKMQESKETTVKNNKVLNKKIKILLNEQNSLFKKLDNISNLI
tara:strand:+ start:18 stop:203 length:186 start_codon:yes stop_codon:yes gene_type:complete